jgi:polyribonucleotide 5'-hydroxyl-kinase
MTEDKIPVQEFKLDPDCELRFELESKNEKMTLEVCLQCVVNIT